MWYVYLLRCGDGSLYTGSTTDVARRVAEHAAGQGARYTRARRPVTLSGAWEYPDRAAAQRAEAHFKALPRAAKETWLAGRWPLAGGRFAFEVMGDPAPFHFCPRCGGALEWRPSETESEPVPVCAVCGRRDYRSAKPCAAVLILRAGALLLVRRCREPYLGYWDIPGGFLNEHETPADGARREAREETGLEVRLLEFLGFYLDTYEYCGDRFTTLNCYFIAEAEGTPQAGDDADDFGWFPLDDLPTAIAFEHAPRVLADLRRWAGGRAGQQDETS